MLIKRGRVLVRLADSRSRRLTLWKCDEVEWREGERIEIRAVESKSLKVGKSLKIGKNRIKSEKSDLISY